MDKKKIEMLCHQILHVAGDEHNGVNVRGEANMLQMIGICRNTRAILVELGKPDKEDDTDGCQEDS